MITTDAEKLKESYVQTQAQTNLQDIWPAATTMKHLCKTKNNVKASDLSFLHFCNDFEYYEY